MSETRQLCLELYVNMTVFVHMQVSQAAIYKTCSAVKNMYGRTYYMYT